MSEVETGAGELRWFPLVELNFKQAEISQVSCQKEHLVRLIWII